MSSLAISCLPKSSWFMDLTFEVPTQYRSSQHRTLRSPPDTSTAESCFCFCPATSSFLELLVSALPQHHTGHLPTQERLIFQCSIFLPFYIFHGVLEADILEWVASSSSRGPLFVRTWLFPVHLRWPRVVRLMALLSYTSPFTPTSLWFLRGQNCGYAQKLQLQSVRI